MQTRTQIYIGVKMKILHISDFHLSEPQGFNEILSKSFYDEYIFKLKDALSEAPELIVITGDIVDKGNASNYAHAKLIIDYLIDTLKIEKDKILICPGNHDFNKDTGACVLSNDITSEYQTLEDKRFRFISINNETTALILDSMDLNNGINKSADFNDEDTHQLLTHIKNKKPKTLIIISHHPPLAPNSQTHSPFDEKNDGYNEKHIWAYGSYILQRLRQIPYNGLNVFWFCGDTHRPEFCAYQNFAHIHVCPSFNLIIPKNEDSKDGDFSSYILPTVGLIDVAAPKDSRHYYYEPEGHKGRGFLGNWKQREIELTNLSTQGTKKESLSKTPATILQSQELKNGEIELLDSDINQSIKEFISKNKLLNFGRFDTNKDISATAWVRTQPMFNDYKLYDSLVKVFIKKVRQLTLSVDSQQLLLVGVDHWGSILASRISQSCDIRFSAIAVKNNRNNYDSFETFNPNLLKEIKNKKIVIVVSDVISTGYSVRRVFDELSEHTNSAKFYNLAVLADPEQDRPNILSPFSKTFTACDAIRIPLIENTKLPCLSIVKSNLNYL